MKKVKLVDIDDKEILKMLYKKEKIYSPKDMRNFKKFLILAECFAGLNFVSNRIDEDTLLIRKEDLLEAFKLWKTNRNVSRCRSNAFCLGCLL